MLGAHVDGRDVLAEGTAPAAAFGLVDDQLGLHGEPILGRDVTPRPWHAADWASHRPEEGDDSGYGAPRFETDIVEKIQHAPILRARSEPEGYRACAFRRARVSWLMKRLGHIEHDAPAHLAGDDLRRQRLDLCDRPRHGQRIEL